jgi:hypothetical protein
VLVPIEQPLSVSSARRLGDDLVPFGEPCAGVVRSDQRGCRRGERVDERRRVADPARDLERFSPDALSTLARRCVAKRRREAREQLDTQHAVLLAQARERVLEQRNEPLVGHRVRPQEPAAVAGGGAGEQVRKRRGASEVGRVQEVRLGPGGVPGRACAPSQDRQAFGCGQSSCSGSPQ